MDPHPVKHAASFSMVDTNTPLHYRTHTHTPGLFLFSLMELEPWEWQPGCYASVAITHKRQGPWGQPAAHSLCLSPHIRQNRYTPLPGFLRYLSLSLSYLLCKTKYILSLPVSLSAGMKSNLRFFFKKDFKGIPAGRKESTCFSRGHFYHLGLIFLGIVSSPAYLCWPISLFGLCVGKYNSLPLTFKLFWSTKHK